MATAHPLIHTYLLPKERKRRKSDARQLEGKNTLETRQVFSLDWWVAIVDLVNTKPIASSHYLAECFVLQGAADCLLEARKKFNKGLVEKSRMVA